MEQLYTCAYSDTKEVLLYLDPMHQIHNNENDYAWQPVGLEGTKKVLANTQDENGSILLAQSRKP